MRRALGIAMCAVLLLCACTHARVVQREPGAHPPRESAPPRPAVSPIPRNGVHIVQRGETLYGISFRYGLRYQDVAAWNGIPDPYLIAIGQRLRVSPSRGGAVSTAPPPSPTPPRRPPAQAPAPPPVVATNTPPSPPPVTAPRPAPPAPPVVAISGSPTWQWPTTGEIIGRYVGSSRVDLQACKLEYSIVSPK